MRETCERPVGQDDYIRISVALLIPSKLCGVSLYTREHDGAPMSLFRGPDYSIDVEDVRRLKAGSRKLYVSSTEHQEFQAYLRENLDETLLDESLDVTHRFTLLNAVVRDVLSEAFENGNVDEAVATTADLGKRTVDLISRDDAVASELYAVLHHDYHTFTHSANVSYYCVMLAKELGITSENELNQIAMGALLHDLGKLEIPESILTKPGKLTEREFDVIKTHPTVGFRQLCERQDLNYAQLMMVYQHHERLDGTGYPVRIGAKEIHSWAKICAVADVFEALTSNRPYRAGMSFDDAFRIMDRQSTTGFDKDIYRCWKNAMQQN